MPVSTASIITRVNKQLYDETNDQWAFVEIMRHMNPGIGEIVQFDPKAYMVNAPFLCASGSLQNLPGDAIALVDCLFNTDEDGKRGRGITQCDFDMMRRGRPDWNRAPPSSTTRQFAADPNDPKRFYLVPPRPGTPGYVQLVYQSVPPDVTAEQYYTSAEAVAGQAVIQLESTVGIVATQWADPADTIGPIKVGSKVLSINPGVSVTLDTPLLVTIPSGTLLTFSDQYPLPDLYAQAQYLFLLWQCLSRRSKDSDQQQAQNYYLEFLQNLDQDTKNIKLIQAGQTKQLPMVATNG